MNTSSIAPCSTSGATSAGRHFLAIATGVTATPVPIWTSSQAMVARTESHAGELQSAPALQRQLENLGAVAVRRDPGQRAVVHAAPACERPVILERLADIFRASIGGVVQERLELHLRRILDGVAALAKFFGFRLGTVNHGLRDARERPHDRLRVETAGNERLAHAAQPRRGRFGADVAVLVPPQEAAGKFVRVFAAAAEPLYEEGRRRFAVEVRKRRAQAVRPARCGDRGP